MRTLPRNTALLALLGNTLLWGIALPIVKLGNLHGLTPSLMLVVRYALAIPLSLPVIYLLRRRPDVRRTFRVSSLLKIILLESATVLTGLFFLYQGLIRSSAINASIIETIKPILIITGGVLFLKERQTRRETAGLVLTLIGTALILFNSSPSSSGGSTLGNLLLLGFILFDSAYFLFAKHIYHGLNKWAATHISFYVLLIGFTLLGFYTGELNAASFAVLTGPDAFWPLFAAFYMALFGSVIGLTLYLVGQDSVEASEAAVFTYLRPVFTIPVSVLLVGESFGFYHLAALGLIILGVFITQKRFH